MIQAVKKLKAVQDKLNLVLELFDALKKEFIETQEQNPELNLRADSKYVNKIISILEKVIKESKFVFDKARLDENLNDQEIETVTSFAKVYQEICTRVLSKIDGLTTVKGKNAIRLFNEIEDALEEIGGLNE